MIELREIIRRETAACGAISFARFMELSLYCPEFGYYERLMNTPGRRGDFFTSVSVGPLFGELLAFQFARWADAAGPQSFQWLESGAHDGRLAADLLHWLGARRPDLLERLEYWILEPSLRRRQWQQKTLAPFAAHLRWFDSWENLPPRGVRGVVFSNELLDAFPVRRLVWDARQKKWFEWMVSWDAERFVWRKLPIDATADSKPPANDPPAAPWGELPARLRDVLPDGFTTEVSPAAAAWWRQAAAALKQGRLLTFDYGLTAGEFFQPQRANGTLRAYHHHRLNDDLLAQVGEQDLTAHVNFTALQSAGESVGLKTEGLIPQTAFLTRTAQEAWKPQSGFGEWTANRSRQFQTLTHPEHLGRRFKVLVQSR